MDPTADDPRLGATPFAAGGFRFEVWAPQARRVGVSYLGRERRTFDLARNDRGYFVGVDPQAVAGDRYWLAVDGRRFPDPASRWQPDGVTGPSALLDLSANRWSPAPPPSADLSRSVLYELHVGTFTAEGTFDAARPHLSELARLGVTAVELLPIGEERGDRGWGYGPVLPFAVRRSYGGPEGLRALVSEAHSAGLAVFLDVVYNHWSSQASFLKRFGPYFHPRATSPWGPTPNVDGTGSDEVRRYFFENARMWLEEYRIDGFRLDAVHEVYDRSALPFWAELSERCRAILAPTGRRPILIAESDLNDVRILRPPADGGWGVDAQWTDDFHNALHAALTGEHIGYYADYDGLEGLAQAFERPFRFEGGFSRVRDRRHGASASGVPPDRFVVFDQNHDQVGNRGDGARLTALLGPELARVALGLTLFSPYVPMLFMGEEYGETRPFYFFSDPPRPFARGLSAGRMRQLRANGFPNPPPDPTLPSTMEQSRLDWDAARSPAGIRYRSFVTELLRLRREMRALSVLGIVQARSWEADRLLAVRRDGAGAAAVLLANLSPVSRAFPPLGWSGAWAEKLCSSGSVPSPDRSDTGGPWSLDSGPSSHEVPARSLVILELSAVRGPSE